MTEAEALADHVVVIERGRAVAAGSLTDLLGTDSDVMTFEARKQWTVAPSPECCPRDDGDRNLPGTTASKARCRHR